jgi:hypothetical protein
MWDIVFKRASTYQKKKKKEASFMLKEINIINNI